MNKISQSSFLIIFTAFIITGCAMGGPHNDNRYRSPASSGDSGSGYDSGSGSRMHPAASLTDQFGVTKDMPKRDSKPNSEFFFKNCSRGGERWTHSRTSYDCDYPF
jgi:hypothetical protein